MTRAAEYLNVVRMTSLFGIPAVIADPLPRDGGERQGAQLELVSSLLGINFFTYSRSNLLAMI